MKKLTAIIVFVCLMSCKQRKPFEARDFSKVEIETLLQDSLLNVRALEISEGRVVAASSNGKIYRSILSYMTDFEEGNYWTHTEDSLLNNNFRSLAFKGDKAFTFSIGRVFECYYHSR